MTDERDAILTSHLEELSISDRRDSPVHSEHGIQGVIPLPSEIEPSAYEDDPHVYVNLAAIENKRILDDIDRRPLPPVPDDDAVPIRVLPSGWQEFKSPGGRTYYYHPESKVGQWKPPRSTQCSALNRQQSGKLSSCSEAESSKEDDSAGGNKIIQTQQTTTFPVENPTSVVSSEDRLYCEVPQEPFSQKPSVSTMTNSVDSGLGRSSISYKNHGFGITKSPMDVMSESVCTLEGNQIEHPINFSKDDSFLFHRNFASSAVKKGNLEKMKLSERGTKVKRKEWIPAYAYLSYGHLLFYKDQKRAEKCGKHYLAPSDVCDLRGAKLSYVDPNSFKDKRRRQIIDLIMADNTEYWFSCAGNDAEVESWYNMLIQTVNTLPSAKAYPTAVLSGNENGSLQRRPSDSYQHQSLSLVKSNQLRGSQKSKSKIPKDSYDVNNESSPTKDSIIERLLKFFRYRPSVEQLRERGIYRPEPIFGSTLVAICQHDRTNVPRFITEITRVIEERGLHVDGIYRVSGNLSSIQKIRCQVDQDRYDVLRKEDDIHVLTGALKLFFRELSEPIFPIFLNKEFMAAIRQTNLKSKVKTIDDLLGKLHVVHKETLRVLLGHLLRVATQADKNRMTIHSLAIMFGPALFSTEDKPPSRNTNTNIPRMKVKADPFRRVHVVKESALILIEFCQVLGPKPIECLPKNPSFNLDQIALWIMSADNEHGSTVTIFNQQLGIYAMIHYSTLLDITARGFQRPFAIAYVTGEDISSEISRKFEEYIMTITTPLLSCNMTMFTYLSEQMVNLANTVQNHDFHQYYALSAEDEPSPEFSKSVQELALQIKRVGPRFRNAFSVLSYCNDQSCSCGSTTEDFKIFLPLIGKASATDLMPLFYLCPCGSESFEDRFRNMFNELTMRHESSGAVIACNTPVINPSNALCNLKFPTSYPKFRYNNTMISFSKCICNIVFSILSNDQIIVAAAKERTSTLQDVLEKLILLKPSKRREEIRIFENLDQLNECTESRQFYGVELNREESLKWISEESSTFSTKIDLNNQKVRCKQYNGHLLKHIHRLHFPHDKPLLSYIAYILTNISKLTILASSASLETVVKDFKLVEDDHLIILNLLIESNFEKYGTFLKPPEKNTKKTMIINI